MRLQDKVCLVTGGAARHRNAVCPGFIATDMLKTVPDKVLEEFRSPCWMRLMGQPDEVAAVYAFLASDDASYINGAVLEVSGGVSV